MLATPAEDNVRRYYETRREQQPIPGAGDLYGEALASYQAGNARASLDSLIALAREYPQVPMLQAALGSATWPRAKPNRQWRTFRQALTLSPRNIPLTMRYTEALLR